jgi:hypothetical protein
LADDSGRVLTIHAALAAWDAGRPEDAREELQNAVHLAQQIKYSAKLMGFRGP